MHIDAACWLSSSKMQRYIMCSGFSFGLLSCGFFFHKTYIRLLAALNPPAAFQIESNKHRFNQEIRSVHMAMTFNAAQLALPGLA